MSQIKDYKDRLFLGRIGFNPERISEAGDGAIALGVNPDGTLAQVETPTPSPEEVTGSTLDGLTAGTNEAIASTDTILEALAKLQAQVDALNV